MVSGNDMAGSLAVGVYLACAGAAVKGIFTTPRQV
jgi:hypothetical protein